MSALDNVINLPILANIKDAVFKENCSKNFLTINVKMHILIEGVSKVVGLAADELLSQLHEIVLHVNEKTRQN